MSGDPWYGSVHIEHEDLCAFLGIDPLLAINRIDVSYDDIVRAWEVKVEFPPPRHRQGQEGSKRAMGEAGRP